MWAKDSDEEDNEDNVRRRVRKPKDFSAPIGFVAGGVQQAGKKKKEEQKKGMVFIACTFLSGRIWSLKCRDPICLPFPLS